MNDHITTDTKQPTPLAIYYRQRLEKSRNPIEVMAILALIHLCHW